MADTISEAIEEAAISGIKRVTEESTSVETHPIADQIAADRHIAERTASSAPPWGLRRAKIVSPGAV